MPPDSPDEKIPVELIPGLEAPPPSEPGPAPTPWNLRELFFFLIFAPSAWLFSNIVVVTVYVALRLLLRWHDSPEALLENPILLVANQTLLYGLVLGYIYHLVVAKYRRPFWTTLNWEKPTAHQTLRLILGGMVLAFAVRFAPTILPDKEDFPLQRMFSSPAAAYVIAAFAILVAPFMEELVFRGVLFSVFERHLGLWFAIGGTGVLFAGLHVHEYWGAWNHVLLILLVGVVFSLARGLTGSLAPSVILHLAYNASLMTALFFETHNFHSIQGILAR